MKEGGDPETADEFWARTTGKGKDSWGNQIAFDDHTQLANLLSGMIEPARQDVLGRIKNAGLVSLAYYTAGFESLPMLAKRLYDTGSLNEPEVQEAIKQGVEDTVKSKPEKRQGMKKGGKGIEALRKEAPEVVERMGYEEGGDVDAQMAMLMLQKKSL